MKTTESLKGQHREIGKVAGEIAGRLSAEALKKDAREVRALLSRLSGKLSVHLAMEDDSLYPLMSQSRDAAVKTTAERFVREMGGVESAFAEYSRKWGTHEAIEANTLAFVLETKAILNEFSKRIEREERELYPLFEKAA